MNDKSPITLQSVPGVLKEGNHSDHYLTSVQKPGELESPSCRAPCAFRQSSIQTNYLAGEGLEPTTFGLEPDELPTAPPCAELPANYRK